MIEIFCNCPTERSFAEEDHPPQALGLDRQYEPLCIRIAVGGLTRRQDHLHPRILEHKRKSSRELSVPITDQEPVAGQETIDGVGQIASRLGHERFARIWRRPSEVDPPRPEIDHE